MIGLYWKQVEKIIKHNYYVKYENKRQEIRNKKLKTFVSKHLRLSSKVAETLKTSAHASTQNMSEMTSNVYVPPAETKIKIMLMPNKGSINENE